jgi:eukaryotic-like serine/threonine-protein kinase
VVNDRYRLVASLASGGMAELFLGVARGAEGFSRKVAIKRMLPQLAQHPLIAKMFLAEARLATHLQHQNIATVYDVGQGPEGLFLVMELVDGWDLGVLLRHAQERGVRFPPHQVAFIATQVLAGLAHAYRRRGDGSQVVSAHRDISPSNILVSREGEVKVTDFGIARVEGLSMGTEPGSFKGKVPYAAPEVLAGQTATSASDQFALGIVLYELLAGRHPFGDETTPLMGFIQAITQRDPPPLEGVPEPLAAVVRRAMAREPELRFSQPEEMAEALSLYLSQAGAPTSSYALATFLRSLQPPPTLVERAEVSEGSEPLAKTLPGSASQAAPVPELLMPTVLSSRPHSSLPDLEGTEWEPQPDGPMLSSSGELVGRSRPAPTPPPAPVRARPVERLELDMRARHSVRTRTVPPAYAPPPEPDASLDIKRLVRWVVIALVVLAVVSRLFQWGQPLVKPLLDSLPLWAGDGR